MTIANDLPSQLPLMSKKDQLLYWLMLNSMYMLVSFQKFFEVWKFFYEKRLNFIFPLCL